MGQKLTPRELDELDGQALIETAETLKKSTPQEVIVTPGLERKEGQRGRYMTARFQQALNVSEPENTDTFFQQCRTEPSFREQAIRKKAKQHSLFSAPEKNSDIDINIDKAHTSIKYFEALCHQCDTNALDQKIDIIRSLYELIKNNKKDKECLYSLFNAINTSGIKLIDFATNRNVTTILFTPIRYFLKPIERTNLLVEKLYPDQSEFQKRRFEALCRKYKTSSNQYLYSLAEKCPESKAIILEKLSDFLSPEYKSAIDELHPNTQDSEPREQVARRRP